MAFAKEQIPAIAEEVDIEIRDNGLYYRGKVLKCDCCEEEITIHNFGSLLPGSVRIYCENPACFTKYVQEKLE